MITVRHEKPQMNHVRWVMRTGLLISLAALTTGLLMVVGAAALAGGWYQARQPLIGLGLDLLTGGLAATALFGALRVVVEPVGWLRLLALPALLVVGLLWAVWLVVGLPTTARCSPCPIPSVGTILYSVPEMIPLVLLATLLIPIPIAISWLGNRRSAGANCG